jgi:predicted ATPase/transcriptional regulator with XRE-family HTH domain
MMTEISFARWLKQRRRELGLTQKELAQAARCSVVTIEKIESGERRPSRQIAGLVAVALDIPPEETPSFIEFARIDGVAVGDEAAASREPWKKLSGLSARVEARHALPAQHTVFIGREDLVSAAQAILSREGTRLVTLTGPPGIGKTRLSIEIAAGIEGFDDGVFFIPLESISDPALVGSAVARGLGLRPTAGKSPDEALAEFLAARRVLLVLDNFEQVIEGALLVSDLLTRAPGLKVLATSREVLELYAERAIEVPPLDLPAADAPILALDEYSSVRLFKDRAEAAKYDFRITEEDAHYVARLCHQLEGLPLTIELAAARVREFTVEGILTRLEQRLDLLSKGARDLPARQRTLRGAISWSYDLLDEGEKQLFRSLSLFRGGFTEEGASALSGLSDRAEVGKMLSSLARKSLLYVSYDAGRVESTPRFAMLESIRAYSHERLVESDELALVEARFTRYFTELAEKAEGELRGPDQLGWMDRLEAEHDNLRAAIRLLLDQERAQDWPLPLHLTAALWRFWLVRGYGREGLDYLEEALSVGSVTGDGAEDDETVLVRAKALNGAGVLASTQGEYPRAHELFNESLRIQRARGDLAGVSALLSNLGNVARALGDYEQALALQEESIQIRRDAGDIAGLALSLSNMGNVLQVLGKLEESYRYQEESLVLLRELGDQQAIATSLNNLAVVLSELGRFEQGQEVFRESLELRRMLGDKRGIAKTLINMGNYLLGAGEWQKAQALQEEGLALNIAVGEKESIAQSIEGLARVLGSQQRWRASVRLWSAAAMLREEIQAPIPPSDREEFDAQVSHAQQHLGAEVFALCWQEGKSLEWGEGPTALLAQASD